jgi:hypothetical protein
MARNWESSISHDCLVQHTTKQRNKDLIMSFSTFHSVGRRLAPLVLRQQQLQKQQRRTMAGLAERPLKTDWTGADKFVRYYFPHDWQRK